MAQKKFIIDGGFQTTDDSIIEANLEMTGHILPTVDSNGTTGFDLGSTTKKWRDLYLSEGSLYIDGQKVIESNSGTIVVQADVNQSLTTQVSGSGVLTLASATSVNIDSTLQMAAGKKITDVGGNAVVFGDKIDADSNKIVNVGAPTGDEDAATKKYVDDELSGLVNGAPGTLDTLNELANALGDDSNFASTMTTNLAAKAATTYVDAADSSVATDAATDASTKATAAQTAAASDATSKANAAEANAISHTNTREVAITTGYETYADVAEADAISTAAADASTKADAAEADAITAAASDATTKADAAQAAAESTASADATTKANAALTSAQTYADTAEADAISSAATDATTKADAALASAQTYADTAEADAISTAAADATSKADAALTSAQTYADTAEADAISSAAADATSKADAALVDAKTYADTAESDAIGTAATDATTKANAAQSSAESTASSDATTKANAAQAAAIAAAATDATSKANAAQSAAISTASGDATTKADAAQAAAIAAVTNGAGAAFDTLKEIQDAMATDTEVATAISAITIGNGSMTVTAGAGMTGGGSFTANQTGNSSVTLNAIAGNGITVNADSIQMSGSYTGSFVATGDITAYSDESLKTNIQTIDGALGKVEAVRGVTFERLEDGSVSTGVVAQELHAVLPEAVKTDENGLHHVAYGNITGLLIEAVKELSAEVKELKNM
jgi:chemotaxis protein histidine kinase CheA